MGKYKAGWRIKIFTAGLRRKFSEKLKNACMNCKTKKRN